MKMAELFLELLCLSQVDVGKPIELLSVLLCRLIKLCLVLCLVLELESSFDLVYVFVQAPELLLL